MRIVRILNRFFLLIITLLLIFSTVVCAKRDENFYRVAEIQDGDTVTIVKDSFLGIFVKTEKVRLIGIDAPELAQEPWGRRAKNYLKKLLRESDWQVRVELDVQQRDRYGRILAYLWDNKGNMINYLLIRNGYAMVYTIPPNVKYADLFVEAQRLAREEKKGIWGKDGLTEKPSDWRKEHPRTKL